MINWPVPIFLPPSQKKYKRNNTEMQATENSNEWIDWINDAITKKLIKYYEYEYFYNIEEIGSGSFGTVYRANWKNSNKCLALKSFTGLNNTTAKEIVHEVIIIKL
jgi:hypothetical protein